MKPLTLPQAILISVVVLVVGALVWKGLIPAAAITGIVGWLLPSPVQGVKGSDDVK